MCFELSMKSYKLLSLRLGFGAKLQREHVMSIELMPDSRSP